MIVLASKNRRGTRLNRRSLLNLTRTISIVMLILEEARRVFADLRREVSPMDMTAVTFVVLLILMPVFFAWWGETRQPGLPG